jgi:hypothetical protein
MVIFVQIPAIRQWVDKFSIQPKAFAKLFNELAPPEYQASVPIKSTLSFIEKYELCDSKKPTVL